MAKTPQGKRKPWVKNLYSNREYPDNYTDVSFLKDLQTNLHVRRYTLREALGGITVLNNQISCITGFLILYHVMLCDRIAPTSILVPTCIITAIGYLYYRGSSLTMIMLGEDSKTLVTVLLFGYIFSPMLHTLTQAISTDTIYTTTFFVMLFNLMFTDYGLDVAMVSKAISLNAAIFGAICLASRLSTSYHAFVLLVEAAIFFVLYPIMTAARWHPYCMVPIFVICCGALYFLSRPVLYLYACTTLFINFACPLIFVRQQHYKFNIHGPWDEAIVEENTEENLDENL
ncbi:phosphatidylinositol N-acetylglucosaminyltransferase subunit C [Drosophila nasuta]|uniref:Phosphatidylinositol N-acetylglucosaminyltransferase subunit C n=1 Tax=Drosophila albomicans TaxID=7291 RepID=A0A6P8Y5J1_DROAB|nr:phosphatidylinositol N-acetylglucosaminyltransferase subunit C [Drosophila albomicans]XP_060653697.1 phosphatidylinositol N-acetylglucosaminyltransferase subunit C [Drosophila nasuta]